MEGWIERKLFQKLTARLMVGSACGDSMGCNDFVVEVVVEDTWSVFFFICKKSFLVCVH